MVSVSWNANWVRLDCVNGRGLYWKQNIPFLWITHLPLLSDWDVRSLLKHFQPKEREEEKEKVFLSTTRYNYIVLCDILKCNIQPVKAFHNFVSVLLSLTPCNTVNGKFLQSYSTTLQHKSAFTHTKDRWLLCKSQPAHQELIHTHSYINSTAIGRGSVSCPKTLWHLDQRSRGLNHRPSGW